jgi:dihydroorotase
VKIEIHHGRVIDPKHGLDRVTSLYLADGAVAAIGAAPPSFSADRVIDARGMVVCPGLIDLSARLREPGFEYKATLESEMEAAVAGGVTSLACPPDTDPPLDEPGLVEMLKHRARSLNQAHVYPIGALTVGLEGVELTEMGELAEAGCVAFSHAEAPLTDTGVLLRAMQYAATFGHRVWLRAQDAHLGKGGVAHDGEVSTRLGLPAIPAVAETIALASILALVRSTGVRVHICRLSTAEGVAMLRAAKQEGLHVTCDVAVHHLHLCDVDIGWFDPQCRLIPPLRGTRDRAALRAGLADGTIDLACSDHTPVDDDGKQVPFGEASRAPRVSNSCCRSRSNGRRKTALRCPALPASRRGLPWFSEAMQVTSMWRPRRTSASSTRRATGGSSRRRSRAKARTPRSWGSKSAER